MRIKQTRLTVTTAWVLSGIVWVSLAAEGGLDYLLVGWLPALLALVLLRVFAGWRED